METGKLKSTGFTLIELMITVVIVGILAAIAYPSYRNWVYQANRADAQQALTSLANRQERYYLNFSPPTYVADLRSLGYSAQTNVTTGGSMYTIAVTAANASSYTLTATPRAGTSQVDDAKCTSLILNSTGVKSATGSDPSSCWK